MKDMVKFLRKYWWILIEKIKFLIEVTIKNRRKNLLKNIEKYKISPKIKVKIEYF